MATTTTVTRLLMITVVLRVLAKISRYIKKWNKVTPPIKEGAMVLVVDERYPAKWPLGRVTKV